MLDLPPQEVVCVAQIVWHEARGESELGKRAVAHVLLNRAKKNKSLPCKEAHKASQFNIKFKKRYTGRAWQDAYRIALYPGKDVTGGALYFRSTKCKNSWSYKITTSIGHHNFYK